MLATDSGAHGELWYDRPTMSGGETVDPLFLPPVIEVFFKALILAEKENAPEIGVDHLLAALDTPAAKTKPVEQSPGPFVPASHRDKPLSNQAKAAIEAAGTRSDLEQLTIDSLRTALLAVKRDYGAQP
jgi:hypothetical protein